MDMWELLVYALVIGMFLSSKKLHVIYDKIKSLKKVKKLNPFKKIHSSYWFIYWNIYTPLKSLVGRG